MRRFAASALAALLQTTGAWAVDLTCTDTGERNHTVDASDIRVLRLETGTGILRLRGSDEIDEVRVSARACSRDPEMLDDIDFRFETDGDVLTLTDRLPEGANHPEAMFARLDLMLNVPSDLIIEVSDRREPLEIANVAGLKVDSGRGEVTISGVTGDAEVRTGRGDLRIENIGGNLTLSRDFGEMIVQNVRGDVVIEWAGRGNSSISNVGGSLRVIRNGRGNIGAQRIGGDFIVEANQAGEIAHRGVEGKVEIADPSGLPADEGQDPEEEEGKGPPHKRP